MAGTPEEDLLGWLDRAEEKVGFDALQDALAQDIEEARLLLYEELGYLSDDQIETLRSASTWRYEELPSIGVTYTSQDVFRDPTTGRFVSRISATWGASPIGYLREEATGKYISFEDAFKMLAKLRGG